VSEQKSGAARVLDVVDWFRGLGGLLLIAGIGIAAILSGGVAGWALGLVLVVLCSLSAVRHFRRGA